MIGFCMGHGLAWRWPPAAATRRSVTTAACPRMPVVSGGRMPDGRLRGPRLDAAGAASKLERAL